MDSNNDFLRIALAARQRGFDWVVPVNDKVPQQKKWLQYSSTRTLPELNLMAQAFPTMSVGIVLKGHAGSVFVWDIDKDGVITRMERATGRKLPATYCVQSRPETAPFKQHIYFIQTEYFASKFPKQVNAGDYDLKGMGGGQVVAEGDRRTDTGEIRRGNGAVIVPIPDWLTDWLVTDSGPLIAAIKDRQRKTQQAIQREASKSLVTKGHRSQYLRTSASKLFEMGFDRTFILRGLVALCRAHIDDGKAWIQTADAKRKVRSIVNTATSRRRKKCVINPVYYRTSLTIKQTSDEQRKNDFQNLVTQAKALPATISPTAAYLALGLNAKDRGHQCRFRRAMTQAGYTHVEKAWTQDQCVVPVSSDSPCLRGLKTEGSTTA